jgi:hypothetical protein
MSNKTHLTIVNDLGRIELIDIDNFLPPSKKEFEYSRSAIYQYLDIPLISRGTKIQICDKAIILHRIINIPKNLNIPESSNKEYFLEQGKTRKKLIMSQKVNFIFLSSGEIDYLNTNRLIYQSYNELTSRVMVLARKFKLSHLIKEIQFLEKPNIV